MEGIGSVPANGQFIDNFLHSLSNTLQNCNCCCNLFENKTGGIKFKNEA